MNGEHFTLLAVIRKIFRYTGLEDIIIESAIIGSVSGGPLWQTL